MFFYNMCGNLNISISWEMNVYDRNTCYGKGISEKNYFP